MATITRGKILRGDLANWDGKNATASRPDATGGTITGLAIGNTVDVLQVFGSGTSRSRGTIAAAVQKIGSSKACLELAPGTWTVDDDLTIPSNFTLRLPAGCLVSVSSTKTLTIAGKIIADRPADLYTGSGSVVVSDESSHFGVYFKTADETTGSVTPVDFSKPPAHVLRYGTNTTPGTTDMSTAFQAAVDGLDKTNGGRVYVPDSRFLIGDILVDGDDFTNGAVYFELHPRAVIDVKPAATYGIKFQGASEASPMQHCGVRGGRFVGTEDGASYGLWFQNCANWLVENTSVVQFKSSPRSTRSGIYVQYAIFGVILKPQIDNCDFGINFENNAANTFRQTTVQVYGGSILSCYRAMRIDDGLQINAYGTTFENSSIGVLYDFTRTTGTNNSSCNLDACYFEGNGLHVKITEHGTAFSSGINMRGCYFENVDTQYPGGSAFEDSGAGDYKVNIDAKNCNIEWCYWSTAPAVADIIIQTGALRNRIGPQNNNSALTVTDNGTSTIKDYESPVASGSDVTIDGIWTFETEPRLANALPLEGLNAAGAATRDLLQINSSDETQLGNTDEDTRILASEQAAVAVGGTTVARFDDDGTAGNTRFFVYDVDNATLERVSVGAADSGGSGFKVLRIPN